MATAIPTQPAGISWWGGIEPDLAPDSVFGPGRCQRLLNVPKAVYYFGTTRLWRLLLYESRLSHRIIERGHLLDELLARPVHPDGIYSEKRRGGAPSGWEVGTLRPNSRSDAVGGPSSTELGDPTAAIGPASTATTPPRPIDEPGLIRTAEQSALMVGVVDSELLSQLRNQTTSRAFPERQLQEIESAIEGVPNAVFKEREIGTFDTLLARGASGVRVRTRA